MSRVKAAVVTALVLSLAGCQQGPTPLLCPDDPNPGPAYKASTYSRGREWTDNGIDVLRGMLNNAMQGAR